MTYPWLKEPIAALTASRVAGRIPHALMIHDSPGAGGEWLASWTTRLVLCTSQGPAPCETCAACRRAAEDIHPDVMRVRPIDDSHQIRIEQVRELCSELALTSHQGSYKIGIVGPADALNRFAANALLKTLEEPPGRTLLVLVATQPSRLPATILSRCQRIRVRPPAREQSLQWLRETRGEADWDAVLDVIGEAPLMAAQLDPAAIIALRGEVERGLDDVFSRRADLAAIATRWSRAELALRLVCFENWLTELIRRRCLASPDLVELRPAAHLPAADSVMNIRKAFELLDRVRELKFLLDTPINAALALESLLHTLRTMHETRTPAAMEASHFRT